IGIGLPLNAADGGTGGVQGAWNGKIQNLGGGGLIGSVGATTSATDAGYVGSSTDGGHTVAEIGPVGNFGIIQATHQLDLGMINDYIYEAEHQQVEWAKALAATYYQMKPLRNYWNGCSTGGRQGLALAELYGEEFDGFVIGAPAVYHEAFRLSDLWPELVVRDLLTAKGKTLSPAQISAVSASAVAACDVQGYDTVADGIIDDPRACTFSATANICGRAGAPAAPNCLDADQAEAVDRVWDGPRNAFGKRIWHPIDRGVTLWTVASSLGSAPQVVAYDHRDINFSTANVFLNRQTMAAAGNPPNGVTYEDEATLGAFNTDPYMETQSADLSKVKRHGGKIIMWQGGQDQLIRWRDSIDYYRRVATFMGEGQANFHALQSWFRYYHAPGVQHCGGGVGPSPTTLLPNGNTQLFDDLVKWVEDGIPPSSAGAATNGGILATGGTGNPARTRPICPWPTTAIYKGTGSTDEAANFTCGGDLDKNPVAVCKMLRTDYRFENANELDSAATGLDGDDQNCLKDSQEPADHYRVPRSGDNDSQ
ncbi:MAG: tannase/feruloyl esterase family alpha/beta hydrolase, partial [Bradyrhizobiaceae bacterium]|nr:tannase/feruloyl esterase family alpha/beta hydrolase [Bradyrhizobiaceae bacterium]